MAENGNGTARWQLWVSMAGVGFVVFGAIVALSWTANSAYSKSIELQDRVNRLSDTVNTNREQIAQLCASLVEVETQFRASDQVRNLMHINDLRVESMLWKKAFAVDYPVSDPYLPSIAQDQPTPCR